MKRIRRFKCIPNNLNPQNENVYCGIVYPDGHCVVGVDCWRLLTRIDTPQYPFKAFRNMNAVVAQFRLLKPEVKPYYLAKLAIFLDCSKSF